MGTQTMLSEYIDTTEGKAELDKCCKKLLSNRIILAWIMKCTMKEYRDYDLEDICSRFIEGDPIIAGITVHQDMDRGRLRKDSNPENLGPGSGEVGGNGSENSRSVGNARGGRVRGDNTVDESVNEGSVTYDIRFRAIVPKSGDIITLMINVEAQGDFWPGYPLLKRGIYYGSRLLSAQFGTEFENAHYEKLKKVYSVWICTHPPVERRHSLSKYEITEHSVVGDYRELEDHYDLMTVIMLCLGNAENRPETSPEDQVIDLLTILLSKELNAEQKKHYLESEYNIPATEEIDEEMRKMCNYSDYVEQAAIEKGLEKGLAEGLEKGLAEGQRMGLIETCKEMGIPRDITLSKLITKFSLAESDAEELLVKYWQ